jgi:hypothetical protein
MSIQFKKKLLFLSSFGFVGAGTGTHTLASLQAITNQNIMQFGIENVLPVITAELETHNRSLREAMATFATPTTEREEAAGVGSDDFEMEEADEFNRPRGQVLTPPSKVGYPLRRFTFAMGWTAEYFNNSTPAALVARLIKAESMHKKALQKAIRKALLTSVNANFVPYIEDLKDTSVIVKPMYNSDGDVPPLGPQLDIFDGTHNHYLNSASLTNAAVAGLINTVAEHTTDATVQIWINKADEAAYRGLSDFRPYLDVRERARTDQSTGLPTLDTGNINNRGIGFINGAEVWVKPWMVTNYSVAINLAATEKPLKMREPVAESRRGFRPIAEIATFPLQARMFEALFGFGGYNRGAAAVLFVGAGGVYVIPSGL